jgi:hypothetical protein
VTPETFFFLIVEAGLPQARPQLKKTNTAQHIKKKGLRQGAVFFIESARFANNIFHTQRMRSVFIDPATGDIDQPAPPLLGLRQKTIFMRALRAMKKMPASGHRPVAFLAVFFYHHVNVRMSCRSNNP